VDQTVPPGSPPEVVFTLPMDEEQGIDLDTEFKIQFSEDMAPESFSGNVSIQYAVGTFSEPKVSFDYDGLSRTLTIRSETLVSGQRIQIILYEGIVGKNGLPLKPAVFLSRRAAMDPRSGRRKALTLTYITR
jgi:hypothetical protein